MNFTQTYQIPPNAHMTYPPELNVSNSPPSLDSIDWPFLDNIDPILLQHEDNSPVLKQISRIFVRSTILNIGSPSRTLRLLQILQIIISKLSQKVDSKKDKIEELQHQIKVVKSKYEKELNKVKTIKQVIADKCPICLKPFKSLPYLDVHIFTKHKEVATLWQAIRTPQPPEAFAFPWDKMHSKMTSTLYPQATQIFGEQAIQQMLTDFRQKFATEQKTSEKEMQEWIDRKMSKVETKIEGLQITAKQEIIAAKNKRGPKNKKKNKKTKQQKQQPIQIQNIKENNNQQVPFAIFHNNSNNLNNNNNNNNNNNFGEQEQQKQFTSQNMQKNVENTFPKSQSQPQVQPQQQPIPKPKAQPQIPTSQNEQNPQNFNNMQIQQNKLMQPLPKPQQQAQQPQQQQQQQEMKNIPKPKDKEIAALNQSKQNASSDNFQFSTTSNANFQSPSPKMLKSGSDAEYDSITPNEFEAKMYQKILQTKNGQQPQQPQNVMQKNISHDAFNISSEYTEYENDAAKNKFGQFEKRNNQNDNDEYSKQLRDFNSSDLYKAAPPPGRSILRYSDSADEKTIPQEVVKRNIVVSDYDENDKVDYYYSEVDDRQFPKGFNKTSSSIESTIRPNNDENFISGTGEILTSPLSERNGRKKINFQSSDGSEVGETTPSLDLPDFTSSTAIKPKFGRKNTNGKLLIEPSKNDNFQPYGIGTVKQKNLPSEKFMKETYRNDISKKVDLNELVDEIIESVSDGY